MSDPVRILESPRHWSGELVPSRRGADEPSHPPVRVEIALFELYDLPPLYRAGSPPGGKHGSGDREYSLLRIDLSIERPAEANVKQIAAHAHVVDRMPGPDSAPPAILSFYPAPDLSPAFGAAGLALDPRLHLEVAPETDRAAGMFCLSPCNCLRLVDASADGEVGVRWVGVPMRNADWPLCQSFVFVTSAPMRSQGYLLFNLSLDVEHDRHVITYRLPEELDFPFHRIQQAQKSARPPSHSRRERRLETTMRDLVLGERMESEGSGAEPARMESASLPDLDPVADRPQIFQIWFATNRRPADGSEDDEYFTGERGDKVHYGICKVQIPKSHKIGSLGSSFLRRLLSGKDDRLKIDSLSELGDALFWLSMGEVLKDLRVDDRMALLFIHGFNTSFREAALRAAQIGYDLRVPGVTALYSWPSKGSMSIKGYEADGAAIEASEPYIEEFLMSFARRKDIERVHVIAHSMGNQALLRVIRRVTARVEDRTRKPFGQIFLAAPDIDRDTFMQFASVYRAVAERTTLYASSKDKALAVSGILHDYARAGFTPPVTLVRGIDTVEVSDVDLTFLGHGYIASMRPLLQDMHNLILHDEPPENRLGLERVVSNEGDYWRIRA